MKFKRHLNNSGDTIVEVLIVLAILGIAIAISFATANGGVQQARNAEEHSEALGIISSQIEELRDALANQQPIPTTPFCMVNLQPKQPGDLGSPCVLQPLSAYPQTINIDPPAITGSNFYDITVKWPGVGNLPTQQEELSYVITPLNSNNTGFCDDNGGSNPC